MNQLPGNAQHQAKTTQGTVSSVPCPHCGKPMDFRELKNQQLLDTGHKCTCDHCKRLVEVVGIHVVEVVVVRPHGPPPAPGPAPTHRELAAQRVRRFLKR
jgi:hypothetical protein